MSDFQFVRSDNHSNGRCYLVQPNLKGSFSRRTSKASLEEAVGLALAIQLKIAGTEILQITNIDPGKFIGTGQAERIGKKLDDIERPSVVILNCSLSPIQQRNLERIWNTKVIDRTALILEIFGARAKTR